MKLVDALAGITFVFLMLLPLLIVMPTPIEGQMGSYAEPTAVLMSVDDIWLLFQRQYHQSRLVPFPAFMLQPSRMYLNLSGEWLVYYDVVGNSVKINGVRLSLAERNPETVKALNDELSRVLSERSWIKAYVPSSNNARGDLYQGYQGVVWYRKQFYLTLPKDGLTATLIFHGVNYIADVWLNGVYLGYHEGGFTPFVFDVTDLLKDGLNELVVRVDNPPWDSEDVRYLIVPYKKCDWWNYGGIYRDVYIEIAPSIRVIRADVTVNRSGDTWRANVNVAVDNKFGAGQVVDLEVCIIPIPLERLERNLTTLRVDTLVSGVEPIQCRHVSVTLRPSNISVLRLEFNGLRVEEWWPENPRLYAVSCKVYMNGEVVDEFYDQFGFRVVKAEGMRILLNGVPVYIKGVSRHEEYPLVGRALSSDQILRDLMIIKEMKANFLRTAHYPNSFLTYVLTDRIGLLVWEEIPVYWFDCQGYIVQMRRGIPLQMLYEMIFRDFNRPSIVVWSLSNEGACREERVAFLRWLADAARKVDRSRLLTQAIAWDLGDDTSVKAGLDVLSVNAYFGVFYGTVVDLDRNLAELRRRYPDIPIIISEFGLWSGGCVGEGWQADYFNRSWSIIRRHTDISGAIWWTAFDYDSMITFNTFGAVDCARQERKLLFYVIQRAYNETPSYITVPSSSSSNATLRMESRDTIIFLPLLLAIPIIGTVLLIRVRRFHD